MPSGKLQEFCSSSLQAFSSCSLANRAWCKYGGVAGLLQSTFFSPANCVPWSWRELLPAGPCRIFALCKELSLIKLITINVLHSLNIFPFFPERKCAFPALGDIAGIRARPSRACGCCTEWDLGAPELFSGLQEEMFWSQQVISSQRERERITIWGNCLFQSLALFLSMTCSSDAATPLGGCGVAACPWDIPRTITRGWSCVQVSL